MPSFPVDRRAHLGAVAAALLVTVLWSSSWILIRRGLDQESLPPLTFAGLRYGAAASVLWVVVLASAQRRRDVRVAVTTVHLRSVAVLGVVFYALTQGAQFIAIDRQPAATTSLLLSLTPLGVAWVGGRALSEHASRTQVVGAMLIVGGAALFFAGDLGWTAVGSIAAVTGLAANILGSLLGRQINRAEALSPVTITTLSMTTGSVLLLIVGLGLDGVPAVSARAALIIGWLAVVNTALAFTLWNWSLRRLSATESAGLNNTMLVQIAVLAWVFLDEYPGLLGLAGIAVVSAGVLLTQRTRAVVQSGSESTRPG